MTKVYFLPFDNGNYQEFTHKFENIADQLMMSKGIEPYDKVAVKLHFQESGNESVIDLSLIRSIIDKLKDKKALPFITDTNTLYTGTRNNSVIHLESAIKNGFDYTNVNAPIIIADGIKGNNYINVPVNLKHFNNIKVATDIYDSDVIISLAHFTCHEMSGFGGSIKNISMGCSSKGGKIDMHSNTKPAVDKEKCTECGKCIDNCLAGAISIHSPAQIDKEKCTGCGKCISSCPNEAIYIFWNERSQSFQEKLIEYFYGITKDKKCIYINFLNDISSICDCYKERRPKIVDDIGILFSFDPIAIDRASADLVNKSQGNTSSELKGGFQENGDKIKGVYPWIDWKLQLKYAEQLGLGSQEYELLSL